MQHAPEVIEPAISVPVRSRIPIRERLAKWEEQNPQVYQESRSGFKANTDPLKLLSELLRKPSSSHLGTTSTEAEDSEWSEQTLRRQIQNDGDTTILTDDLEPGDLVDYACVLQ